MEFLERFLQSFPDLIDRERARHGWQSLHDQAGPASEDALRFGVRELSVTLSSRSPATVRWLAEAFRPQPFTSSTAQQAREMAQRILGGLRDTWQVGSSSEQFDRLFDLAYPSSNPPGDPRAFRIGYALELQARKAPGFKWYGDPRSARPDEAGSRMNDITASLGLQTQWRKLNESVRRRVPGAALRGFGIEIPHGGEPGLEVYFTARAVDWDQIQTLSVHALGQRDSQMMDRFHRLMLKGRARLPPSAILLRGRLSRSIAPDMGSLKWSACLPQLHTSDVQLQERIIVLCDALELDATPYLRLWQVAVGSTPIEELIHVHRSASLSFDDDGSPQMHLHLRAPEHATEHIPMRLRPMRLGQSTVSARAQSAVHRGLVRILDAAETGYSEMTHEMVFRREVGLGEHDESSLGLVLQRSVVCSLLAAARSRFDIDGARLQTELNALETAQDRSSGGWKYFPDLLPLPPDANVLAQVLLAFLEARDQRSESLFARALDLVEKLLGWDGTIATWLMDPDAEDPGTKVQRDAVTRWWGNGADPEVVATLAFALIRRDPARFGRWAVRACDWIATRQSDQGWWESTWYWGRMHGTWVAIRLLATVLGQDEAILRTAAWWAESQAPDGSWQTELETAYGLLTGIELVKAGYLERDTEQLVRAAQWLASRQHADGSWDASPWLRMDVRRAETQRGRTSPRFVSYESRTLTTTICAQALLEFQSLEDVSWKPTVATTPTHLEPARITAMAS